MEHRVGIGYDIHRLISDRKLFIGGIEIPYVKGLLGHSDGDVLLHAVCDALLGALAEADIGELFPDTDPKYHDISSIELLETVNELVKKKGFIIGNIDTVVVAQEPMLSPFKEAIKEAIAEILNIEKRRVNVKAKTNEGLGELGRKEAIAAYAVVVITEEG